MGYSVLAVVRFIRQLKAEGSKLEGGWKKTTVIGRMPSLSAFTFELSARAASTQNVSEPRPSVKAHRPATGGKKVMGGIRSAG
jgi:hypothetical protein